MRRDFAIGQIVRADSIGFLDESLGHLFEITVRAQIGRRGGGSRVNRTQLEIFF
jgi:hypothetical protein